jgi:hypothetical protein
LSYVYARVSNLLICPEVDTEACRTSSIPDHLREQRIDWLQLEPALTIGLGRGFQLSARLPVQVQLIGTRHTTVADEVPYEPTYPGAPPAREVHAGLGDARIAAWYLARPAEGWTVGGSLGHTLPLGEPPSDPTGTTPGATSEPFRSGAGTVAPTAGFIAVGSKGRWGGWFGAQAMVPVVANAQGYRAPWTLGVSVGPSVRPVPELQLLWTVDPFVEGRARWQDQAQGGRVALATGLSVLGMVRSNLVLQAQVSATVWQTGWSRGDEGVGPAVVASLGVSWTSGRAAEEHHEEEPPAPDEPLPTASPP